jgi:selenocysteine lyase/cysteine desulfurase
MDLTEFRRQFPALRSITWLDTATAPPAATVVADALDGARRAWAEGAFDWQDWEIEADATRGPFGALIGADAETIALLPSLSEAAATVAQSIPAGRIVVGADEFRSNLFPWLATEARGSTIATVPSRDRVLRTEDLVAAIDGTTVLVAVSAVQSSTGTRVALGDIADRCRDLGARLFVNATQQLGALRLDAGELRPDYLASHGYKWLLGPRGAAWLHVRPDRIDELRPLAPSWKTVSDPLADYYGGRVDPAPGARKLDASLAWFAWVGARAALDLVRSLDPDQVERRALGLASSLRAEAEEMGFRAIPEQQPSQIVSLAVADSETTVRELAARGVRGAARDGLVRLGFHGFNDTDDLGAAVRALHALRRS